MLLLFYSLLRCKAYFWVELTIWQKSVNRTKLMKTVNLFPLHALVDPAHLQKQIKGNAWSCGAREDRAHFSRHPTLRSAAPLVFLLVLTLTRPGRSSHVSAVHLQKLWRRQQEGIQLLLCRRRWLWRKRGQDQDQLQLLLHVPGDRRQRTLRRLQQQEPPQLGWRRKDFHGWLLRRWLWM